MNPSFEQNQQFNLFHESTETPNKFREIVRKTKL